MKNVKIVARVLFIISILLSAGYLLTVLYSAVCLLTNTAITPYGEGQFLHINYPFTSKPFLNVDNNAAYLLCSFLLPLFLYGLFFLLAAFVFRVFYQPKLFTQKNVAHLRRFYLFNIFVPAIAVLACSFFVEIEGTAAGLTGMHFFVGIFVYFLTAIFKQGLNLQNEQDLFI